MGKKKWTGPNERKRHHQHKGGRGARRGGGRGGGPKRFGDKPEREERPQFDRTPKEERQLRPGLTELDVGITEYVGKTDGFTGVIKARFSDFHVNEIDVDGTVLRLTDTSLPQLPAVDTSQFDDNERTVIELLTPATWQRIAEVADSVPAERQTVECDVHAFTKDQRSLVHNTINGIYGRRLVGSTVELDGRRHIRLVRFAKGDQRPDARTKWLWPHEYTYFLVHKENCDTMRAAADLAANLNTAPGTLAYAGTKDKRGKTTQWFCARKREPEKIRRAAERLHNVHVGNFTFRPDTLKLGSLRGNQFRVALRHIDADAETIDASLASLRANGFVNYYGLQRFGNCAAIPTYRVGLALLRGQFQEAVELVLKPRDGDATFMRAVREHWWRTRDAAAALQMLFRTNTGVEAKLLAGLQKNGPNDYVNALENIPRNMRLMYIHAYQSLVWNEMASCRMLLSQEPLVGDLVYVDRATDEAAERLAAASTGDDEPDAETGDPETEEHDAEEPEPEVSRFRTMVRPLTADDIASGKYALCDVVLPLPGHDITYPSNEVGKWYAERLARDELSSEKLKQKQKAYSLTGAYRKLIVVPEKLSWQLVRHASDTDNLIRSDWEALNGEPEPELTADGPLRSLLVQFELPSSTYATMVLREILKADTSPANQAKLAQDALDADAKTADGAADETGEKRKSADDKSDGDDDSDASEDGKAAAKKQKVE